MSLLTKMRRWSLPTKISLSIGAVGVLIALVAYLFPQTSPDEASPTNIGTGTQVLGSVSNTGTGTQVVGSGNTVVLAPTRPPQPIESVDLEISFSIPLDNPALSEYADRLDKGLREYLAAEPDLSGARTGIGFRLRRKILGKPDADPVGQVWVGAGHALFPSHDAQNGFARNSLSIGVIELAFYRTPISPPDFQVSEGGVFRLSGRPQARLHPDLGIMKPTPFAADWLLWGNVTPATVTYRLALLERWVPPKSLWNVESGAIQYVQDLPGSQLLINLGRFRGATADVAREFELAEIALRINYRTLAITPENVTKHLTTDGDPFWEFRFPDELEAAFGSVRALDGAEQNLDSAEESYVAAIGEERPTTVAADPAVVAQRAYVDVTQVKLDVTKGEVTFLVRNLGNTPAALSRIRTTWLAGALPEHPSYQIAHELNGTQLSPRGGVIRQAIVLTPPGKPEILEGIATRRPVWYAVRIEYRDAFGEHAFCTILRRNHDTGDMEISPAANFHCNE